MMIISPISGIPSDEATIALYTALDIYTLTTTGSRVSGHLVEPNNLRSEFALCQFK